MNLSQLIEKHSIPVITEVGKFESASELLEFTKPLHDVEGFVVRWPDGHMVKAKAEQYLRIHKVKDLIRTERHIAALILNEELDDILPLLDQSDRKMVHDYGCKLHSSIENVISRIEKIVKNAKELYGENRKEIALNFIPTLKYKEDARFIFGAIDGRDIREEVLKKISIDVGNTTKYEEMKRWIEWQT